MDRPARDPVDGTADLEIQSLARECHQALILAILSSGPHHGYQLALELEDKSGGAFRLNHGTLYPILHRLEQQGLIEGNWLNETTRRKRKRYSLTRAGKLRLAQRTEAWRAFMTRFFAILGEVE